MADQSGLKEKNIAKNGLKTIEEGDEGWENFFLFIEKKAAFYFIRIFFWRFLAMRAVV